MVQPPQEKPEEFRDAVTPPDFFKSTEDIFKDGEVIHGEITLCVNPMMGGLTRLIYTVKCDDGRVAHIDSEMHGIAIGTRVEGTVVITPDTRFDQSKITLKNIRLAPPAADHTPPSP